jgi:hypothetical protein
LPTGFAITLFHICFMYPTNITVVSKVSREIVYNQNFKEERILRGIHMNISSNQLLAYSPAKIISVASLQGEDKDAWKYYLRKANVKMALDSCTGPDSAKKRALVNGTHANTLFENGNFVMAAQYYALSNFSFESVALKFIKKRQIKSLEEYLVRVLNVYKASKDQIND